MLPLPPLSMSYTSLLPLSLSPSPPLSLPLSPSPSPIRTVPWSHCRTNRRRYRVSVSSQAEWPNYKTWSTLSRHTITRQMGLTTWSCSSAESTVVTPVFLTY